MTRISPCYNETCDGGSLLWNGDGSNFVLADTNGLVVEADSADQHCMRYRETRGGPIEQGLFDAPCTEEFYVVRV